MSGGWEQVYDLQIELHHYWNTPAGVRFLDQFLRSMEGKGQLHTGHDENMKYVWGGLTSSLYHGDPFYVADEMMDVIESARDGFRPEPLLEGDLITPYGFVVFPRAIWMLDRNERRVAIRAVSWMPCQEDRSGRKGVLLGVYSHKDDTDDYGEAHWPTTLTLLHFIPWYYEEGFTGEKWQETGSVAESLRDLQVFWRLSMQYVAERGRMQPPRSARRRAKRDGFPEKYVVVIRLRRHRAKREGEPSDVEWSHRWLVGGHWRNQWYPTLDAHRQIYIGAYVKGPEDKELRLRQGRAFELVR